MDIRKLQRTIVDALEDVKAQDIQVFNTEALTSLFDRVIIASGSSNRQTRALAASVRDKVRSAGGEVKNPEGADSGEWVLVDCGDAVVHIMQPTIRAYYKLEDIWGGKSVHLKRPGAESASSGAKAPAGAARKAPARKRPAAKTTSRSATQAPSTTARKSAAPKTAAAKSAAPRPAAKKTAARPAAPSGTKAASPRRAPAKRTSTKG